MSDTIYMNTLTHDEYDPKYNGFCITISHDYNGKFIIEHNGLDNVTDEDITKLREIANALEFLKLLKK